jgi:L-glutamine---4-(methylsulfanyl)-2-oxobutanoate aminotransferase
MHDHTVTISGLGKTYALTGWRVGWAVAHPALTALIRKVHDYLTICAPAPFQVAGVTALGLPKKFYTTLRAEYAARCAILLPALTQAGFCYHLPEGAYYVMADFAQLAWPINRYTRSSWTLDRAFSEYMAREVGVAVVPGSSFYSGHTGGTTRVRFNFAKQAHTLREAARRLENLPG